VSDGAVFDLRVTPVTKQIGDAAVRMLAYNGSIPGPTLHVRQGTEMVVNAANDGGRCRRGCGKEPQVGITCRL
jgi:multicopper oxidase